MHSHNAASGTYTLSEFKPPWWATNRHVQTIYPRFMQARAKIEQTRSRLNLPDGDFVDLVWVGDITMCKALVVLFHGLEGSMRSHYANDMAANLHRQGYAVVLMHFRGCGGDANVLTRAYHSGDTADAWFFLNTLQEQYPNIMKFGMGFSLGANMLLKLVGEYVEQDILKAVFCVSPPLQLAECALAINHGFARVYQSHLLKSMVRKLIAKMQYIDYSGVLKITEPDAEKLQSFREFDEHVTAPLHGFEGADDYYQKNSAMGYLASIATPTLILHAKDDPFMNHNVIPQEAQLSPKVQYELSDNGGHVGFMQGSPWRPKIWMHERANTFISQFISSE